MCLLLKHLGNTDQDIITDFSSVDIIDHLEALDIGSHHDITLLRILDEHFLHEGVEIVRIVQSGQGIMRRLVAFLVQSPLLLGTVSRRDETADRMILLVIDPLQLQIKRVPLVAEIKIANCLEITLCQDILHDVFITLGQHLDRVFPRFVRGLPDEVKDLLRTTVGIDTYIVRITEKDRLGDIRQHLSEHPVRRKIGFIYQCKKADQNREKSIGDHRIFQNGSIDDVV